MPTVTLKLSVTEAARLKRLSRQNHKTKSAYLRSLLAERLETTDDWLRAAETGTLRPLYPVRRRRRRAAA